MVAALAFLVWDVLTTLDDEVFHMWITRFQPLKVLYFFTRYYSVVVLIAINTHSLTCEQWVIIEAVSAVLLEAVVEVILILRLYALYTASRRVLGILLGALIAQLIMMSVSLGVSLPGVMASPMCIETKFPRMIIAYTISSVVFEGVLFGLTIHKFLEAQKEGWGYISLLNVLIRDSIWAFALLFIANIANTLLFTIAPASLAALGFPWLLAILGTVGPRLVLNLRREHSEHVSRTFNISVHSAYAPVSLHDDEDHIASQPLNISFPSVATQGSHQRWD